MNNSEFKVNDQVKTVGIEEVFVIVEIVGGEAEVMNKKGSVINRPLLSLRKVY